MLIMYEYIFNNLNNKIKNILNNKIKNIVLNVINNSHKYTNIIIIYDNLIKIINIKI